LFRWNKIIYMNKWWKSEKNRNTRCLLGITHKGAWSEAYM
jgi:hypothetical protein